MKQTPEQRAEARFNKEKSYIDFHNHYGYLACIREEVEPRDAEIERLRALVQALVNCIGIADTYGQFREQGPYDFDPESGYHKWQQYEISAIAAAKEQGFVPTNTTEG